MLILDPKNAVPLVTQIVDGLKQQITDNRIRAGSKVLSIRQFAEAHGVSSSTVVEAYDRLVAEGFLVPRQSAGFFVRVSNHSLYREERQSLRNIRFDPLWFVRRVWENSSADVTPGYGWVPDAWLDGELLRRAMRTMASKTGTHADGYGLPKGLTALRLKVCDWLSQQEIPAAPDQVLLTTGASHALQLVARYLIRPGDTVLIDEPGYSVMIANLRALGANVIGVPWTPAGPDLQVFESLITEHRPRAFFTNPRLHNPTGASYSAAVSHRILQLADRYDFVIVEDDVCVDLDTSSRRSLACLDQLRRVIYVTSYSKSISPKLRVGFVVADQSAIEDMTQIKMMTGLTSSEINERLVLELLMEGRYRKQIKSLKDNLSAARESVGNGLTAAGMEIFAEANAGLFLWARHPKFSDSAALCNAALDNNLLLAPGHLFMINGQPSPWMRFNVGYSNSDALYRFLASQ